MNGWWEAVVTYSNADDHFLLRWRHFPDDGEITRAGNDLGLIPPGSREARLGSWQPLSSPRARTGCAT